MYSLIPEKPLRLVYKPFYLAIRRLFKDFLRERLLWLTDEKDIGAKGIFL